MLTKAEALEASIKHWEENLAATAPVSAVLSSTSCALCRLYLASGCSNCPVYAKTGKNLCYDTPYWDADKGKDVWIWESDDTSFRIAAQAEVNFLKSLREPSE